VSVYIEKGRRKKMELEVRRGGGLGGKKREEAPATAHNETSVNKPTIV
jgi:hypothetical protein